MSAPARAFHRIFVGPTRLLIDHPLARRGFDPAGFSADVVRRRQVHRQSSRTLGRMRVRYGISGLTMILSGRTSSQVEFDFFEAWRRTSQAIAVQVMARGTCSEIENATPVTPCRSCFSPCEHDLALGRSRPPRSGHSQPNNPKLCSRLLQTLCGWEVARGARLSEASAIDHRVDSGRLGTPGIHRRFHRRSHSNPASSAFTPMPPNAIHHLVSRARPLTNTVVA